MPCGSLKPKFHRTLPGFCGVAQGAFSTHERAALLGLPPDKRRSGFFHLWSQKEAYLKARGDGTARGLDHFDMEADPRLGARLLADRRDPQAPSRWWLTALDVGPSFRAALAAEAVAPSVRCFAR